MKSSPKSTLQCIFLAAMAFIVLPGIAQGQNNDSESSLSISEEQAMAIDTLVAQDIGFDPVEYHAEQIFFTPSGVRYDIEMAVTTTEPNEIGHNLSGYAWTHKLTDAQEQVLTDPDSLPNTCVTVVDLDAYDNTDEYQNAITDYWGSCGYLITSKPSVSGDRLEVYPNPSESGFYLKPYRAVSTVIITDPTGHTVYEKSLQLQGGAARYLQPDLAPGLYIVRAISPEGIIATAKIIIK